MFVPRAVQGFSSVNLGKRKVEHKAEWSGQDTHQYLHLTTRIEHHCYIQRMGILN
jgi:hypothetical protein